MAIRKCLLGGILGVFFISIRAQNARMNLLHEKNRLSFEIRFHEKIVIPSSTLGLNIDNRVLGQELSSAPSLISSDKGIKCYEIKHKDGSILYPDIKESDDGIAFQYRILPFLRTPRYGTPAVPFNMSGFKHTRNGR